MNLELSEEQTAALEKELRDIVENDRYPFSPRIRTLREILHMVQPEPLTFGQRNGGTASTPVRNLYLPYDITSRRERQLRGDGAVRVSSDDEETPVGETGVS